MATTFKEKKGRGIWKAILTITISFLMLPILTIIMVYFSNENFRFKSNEFLSAFPGPIGNYFNSQPTKEEINQMKVKIAKQYISLEEDRLIDKLLLIKAEDESLYNDLIILLSRENSRKMHSVKEKLRNTEIRENILIRMTNEIQEQELAKANDMINYIASLDPVSALYEIEKMYEEGTVDLKELRNIFINMPIENAANYLRYLEEELAYKIMFDLPSATKTNIQHLIDQMIRKENNLNDLAKIYETKPVEELIEEIGSIDKFRIKDLAYIYRNMTIKKAAHVLSKVEDLEFTMRLYDNIRQLDRLNRLGDDYGVKLSEAAEVYRKYEKRVNELVEIYQRLSQQELAAIIEEMINRNQVIFNHSISEEEQIIFTEEKLAIDILQKLRTNIVVGLIKEFNTEKAIEIARKIIARR